MIVQVDIYMPRMDVMFKEGPVPKERGPIAPIRKHWLNFIEMLNVAHIGKGDQTKIYELPLWQITSERVKENSPDADMIYIPHKMRENWLLDDRIRYYMQMVIPTIFSIDPYGWGATAKSYPLRDFNSSEKHKPEIYDSMAKRIQSNTSKFDQPERKPLLLNYVQNDGHKRRLYDYVFFPCQIPHDETIKYHSPISVEETLECVLKWASGTGKHVVIKGHPVNPGSMASIKEVAKRYPHIWVDDYSIHDLIENAKMVVTVNSGVGLEAILHGKQVVTFGRADYDQVTYNANDKNFYDVLSGAYSTADLVNISRYKRFLDHWYHTYYDTENAETFEKVG